MLLRLRPVRLGANYLVPLSRPELIPLVAGHGRTKAIITRMDIAAAIPVLLRVRTTITTTGWRDGGKKKKG